MKNEGVARKLAYTSEAIRVAPASMMDLGAIMLTPTEEQ